MWCVCVCPILYPPCIYRREPPDTAPQTDLEEHPGGDTWRSWGGGAHGRQPPPTAGGWACLGLLVWSMLGLACLDSFCFGSWATLVQLSLNRCSDIFYDFLSGQSVLVTCILAQKHILHILEGKVWFMNFIEYKCVQEMQTLMIFWSSWCLEMVVSERQ